MANELCASRLVAPYYGTSSFVWTNIIGVIMVALSAGYFVGGKLADRKPQLGILLKLLMAACGFLSLLPFVVTPLSSGSHLLWKPLILLFRSYFSGRCRP